MPWNRNEPDPIENKRRQLAEQERLLAEQMSRLTDKLQQTGQSPSDLKSNEPPVWRMEDDHHHGRRAPEPTSARKGALARQRRRDMLLFFLFISVFLIVLGIVLWAYYAPPEASP